LGAVPESELYEDAAHVGLHGRLADDEALGDLGVAETARQEADD
jgi:hypothetical protein